MKHYDLWLYNKSKSLNLKNKEKAIQDVLKDLENLGKVTIHEFIVYKDRISLDIVEENSKQWHQDFGKILANEYDMRRYCDPKDETRLFSWNNKPTDFSTLF